MNYVLTIIILLACGGAYYEHKLGEQDRIDAAQQIDALNGKIATLETANKQLDDDKAKLSQSLADSAKEIAGLNAQMQAVQEASEQAMAAAKAQQTSPSGSPSSATMSGAGNSLGTITTIAGTNFQNCKLLKVEADGITFSHSAGITKVLFGLLPTDMQKRFGFDSLHATELTAEQVEMQEAQRKAVAPSVAY